MPEPTLAIITPTFNCAKYISQTIDSVINQCYPELDYWVIDDGSTDDTQQVLRKYHGKGICLIYHRDNKGEQATVNECLEWIGRYKKAKYFMIVNSDDPLLPGSIRKLIGFMEAHPDILCAYPDWQSINEDGTFHHHVKTREYDFSYMIRHHTWLMGVGSIFRASVIQSVGLRDTSYHWLGDADYWLRVGLAGKMARVPETLATWRHRDGQESGKKNSARAKEHIRIMREFFLRPTNGLVQYYPEAICWSFLVAASVTDNRLESVGYIYEAIHSYPKMLLKFEFYDALIKRANYILRR